MLMWPHLGKSNAFLFSDKCSLCVWNTAYKLNTWLFSRYMDLISIINTKCLFYGTLQSVKQQSPSLTYSLFFKIFHLYLSITPRLKSFSWVTLSPPSRSVKRFLSRLFQTSPVFIITQPGANGFWRWIQTAPSPVSEKFC